MRPIKLSIVLAIAFLAQPLFSQQLDRNQLFINRYAQLAKQEMIRTGIPASIKLAQAILESGAGTSDLAVRGNNHFAIKAHNWYGETILRKDDDYRNGKLIHSAFRKYDDPYDSWMDHSQFLKKSNYSALFELKPDDYKGWARGLKKAGYATARDYPQKLIRLIKRYKLYEYDRQVLDGTFTMADVAINKQEDVTYTYAKAGETPGFIAQRTGLSVSDILKYNPSFKKVAPIGEGVKVWLTDPARTAPAAPKPDVKVVKYKPDAPDASPDQSKVNKPLTIPLDLKFDEAPKKEQATAKFVLNLRMPDQQQAREDYSGPPAKTWPPKGSTKPIASAKSMKTKSTQLVPTTKFHRVQPGETLYSLARKYNTSVKNLKRWNKLTGNNLPVGMNLRVSTTQK